MPPTYAPTFGPEDASDDDSEYGVDSRSELDSDMAADDHDDDPSLSMVASRTLSDKAGDMTASMLLEREEEPEGMLPRDKQRRTTHYNSSLEKAMSHSEAKQFYQRQEEDIVGMVILNLNISLITQPPGV